jgi:hypothetical protein
VHIASAADLAACSWLDPEVSEHDVSQRRFSYDPTEFGGKRALVPGGTEGMGEAIVRRLAAEVRRWRPRRARRLVKIRRPSFIGQAGRRLSSAEGEDAGYITEILGRLGGVVTSWSHTSAVRVRAWAAACSPSSDRGFGSTP